MNVRIIETDGIVYIEGISDKILIENERDAVDIVGLCGEHDTHRLMLHADNLTDQFFDLKTRLAGDVLQKFANYGIKTTLVLPPDFIQQKRFGEMSVEANRGSHFSVFHNWADAEKWLVQT
jgi:hypothetical protein